MQVYYYYSQRSKTEINAARDAAQKATLKDTPRPRRSFAKKISEYLMAEFRHAVRGAASLGVFAKRKAICLACPRRLTELDGKTDEGGIGFCGACGCPSSRRSQLSVKLTMGGVPCPLGKFGKAGGTGGSISTAVDAARGVVTSAITYARKKR